MPQASEQPHEARAAGRPIHERWSDQGAGQRYARERWSSARRAARDPRLVERLLARAGVRGATILDAPCGAGRLQPVLARRARRLVGVDFSSAMLSEARAARWTVARADLRRLPFAGASFEVVVCCRLLHHIGDRALLAAVAAELCRVSSGLVIASFWDRASLPGLRRKLGRKRKGARVARARSEMRAVFGAAGAEVEAFAHSFRWISQQTFLLARKKP